MLNFLNFSGIIFDLPMGLLLRLEATRSFRQQNQRTSFNRKVRKCLKRIKFVLIFFFTSPKIGSCLDIKITTSLKSLDKCFYHVMAKGIMLESSCISFVNQTATLSFIPSFSYSYQTSIIFFYYDAFAQIVSTQVYLTFVNDLPNFVRTN